MKKKQMTKKQITDLMAYFSLMAISKNSEQLLEKYFDSDTVDKMMRVCVRLFDTDNEKAESYISTNVEKLLKRLKEHDDTGYTIKNFKGDIVE